jgi:formylglycine-generating enzyme required for sulfatase activity
MRFGFRSLLCLLLLIACQPLSSLKQPDLDGMRVVPAGWFLMGENDKRPSNQPQRWVYLDLFAIDRTEVTRQAYITYLLESGYPIDDTSSQLLADIASLPMTGVLWRDADAYCRWHAKRLPSEAEWEKAARGDDGRRYPWGNRWDASLANTIENDLAGVLPVGSFSRGASPYGVLDMAGNAAEWVADYYDPAYYSKAPIENPQGPSEIVDHVLRGGSWDSPSDQVTTFFRDSSHSARPNLRVGFRCALPLEPAK